MKILTEQQIRQKVKRIAIEILEHNVDAPVLYLAGINNNGYQFAALLLEALRQHHNAPEVILTQVRLNPAQPAAHPIRLDTPLQQLEGQRIIIVDDVANTGRTLLYALKPLMEIVPKRIEIAVLVDRKHKSFPIQADYVGMSLATTLKNDIDVQIRDVEEWAVYLN